MKSATRLLLHFIFVTCATMACAAPKPDILIVMPDQMRGDCLSAVGHPVVRTPTLDALAKDGALFRRAYSTCPSCIPARYSLLTGLFPATSGVVGFRGKPITHPTLPGLLAEAGYTTTLVGRNMHQVPDGDFYGYQTQVRGSVYVSDDAYDNFLKKAAPETGGIRKLVADLGLSNNGWEGRPWPLTENLHPISWIVNESQKVLQTADTNKPLFLTTSFFTPHPPLFPLSNYFNHYANEKLPAPAHGDWVKWNTLKPEGNAKGDRVLLEGTALKKAQSGYYGLIEQLDAAIAPLIAAFKERSEKAGHPWLVVFITDHGEMMGDNGYFRKCEPYEGSANIPFLVAGSANFNFKPNLRPRDIVCLEDMMPTLLDAAGVKIPKLMDGISLLPTLRGEGKPIRTTLPYEHAPCYNKEQSFHAITDERYKYIWRPSSGVEQLFDLSKDPREGKDLSKKEPETLKKFHEQMIKLLAGRPEGFTDGKSLIAGRPYPPIQEKKEE